MSIKILIISFEIYTVQSVYYYSRRWVTDILSIDQIYIQNHAAKKLIKIFCFVLVYLNFKDG